METLALKKRLLAVDGPGNTGKSTLMQMLAKERGLYYCNTGSLYRVFTLMALQDHVNIEDEAYVSAFALNSRLRVSIMDGKTCIDGVEVGYLKTDEINTNVSKVSKYKEVRCVVKRFQDEVIRTHKSGVGMEGRDICTLYPDAALKLYLDASPEIRAKRQVLDNMAKNLGSTDYDVVYTDLMARDDQDSKRAHSPLVCAPGALRIDTGLSTIDELVASVLKLWDNAVANAQFEQ